jgi:hypothetical protein
VPRYGSCEASPSAPDVGSFGVPTVVAEARPSAHASDGTDAGRTGYLVKAIVESVAGHPVVAGFIRVRRGRVVLFGDVDVVLSS